MQEKWRRMFFPGRLATISKMNEFDRASAKKEWLFQQLKLSSLNFRGAKLRLICSSARAMLRETARRDIMFNRPMGRTHWHIIRGVMISFKWRELVLGSQVGPLKAARL